MAQDPYAPPRAEVASSENITYQPSWFSLRGRIGRLRYLAYATGLNILGGLCVAFLSGLLGVVVDPESGVIPSGIGGVVLVVIYLAMLVLIIGFGVRRMNDVNRSGWWLLLAFVPVVNLLLLLYLLFAAGTDGLNDFGPAPVANTAGVVILGLVLPLIFLIGIVAAIMVPVMVAAT